MVSGSEGIVKTVTEGRRLDRRASAMRDRPRHGTGNGTVSEKRTSFGSNGSVTTCGFNRPLRTVENARNELIRQC
jgi:hypothetical protein